MKKLEKKLNILWNIHKKRRNMGVGRIRGLALKLKCIELMQQLKEKRGYKTKLGVYHLEVTPEP